MIIITFAISLDYSAAELSDCIPLTYTWKT